MIYFLSFISITLVVLLLWVFFKNGNLADDNEYLSELVQKLDSENRALREGGLMRGISAKTESFENSKQGIHVDEDGIVTDNRWKI